MQVYGKNVAYEYLLSDEKIKSIYLQEGFNDSEIIYMINKKNIKFRYMKKQDMDKISGGLHQGIILEIPDYEYKSLDDFIHKDNAFVVILDHLEDPHNFGAIIRTCEAAGVDGIIIPKDRSVSVNATVIKTSVGTANSVNIACVTNLVNTINELKENGFWIYGMDMKGEDYSTLDYNGKIAIICGNEGHGLSSLVRKNCDFIASIPMKGNVNSLNASVATALVIFEANKSRKD